MSTIQKPSPWQVLVVEDGDEYLETLTNFVAEGFDYRQAKDGAQACAFAAERAPDLFFLDMRFDRIPVERLLGDDDKIVARFNGDRLRARSYLVDNQGLYILAELRKHGFTQPAVLSYDFTDEPQRFAALRRLHGPLEACPDYASAQAMRRSMEAAVDRSSDTGGS